LFSGVGNKILSLTKSSARPRSATGLLLNGEGRPLPESKSERFYDADHSPQMGYVIRVLYKYVPISSYYFVGVDRETIFDLCLTGMRYGGAEVNDPYFLFISNRCRVGAG